ncbi:centromere protein Q isoform B [Alligator mississippiensis]|uniref:Centromere protein Q n=1 Tax=Alligator mississippiensis TaxID=8496 RepID=A0A151NBG7_ALLMI|nr:centromere protein Q isoform B [Alligator mississippiensis]
MRGATRENRPDNGLCSQRWVRGELCGHEASSCSCHLTSVRGGFKVKQTAKKRGKQYREQSPEEMASGKTKRVKKATSKTADWQPLSESSREILDSMMDSVILSILSQELIAKEDIQKHLDLLKERLQRHFKNLKVPSGKLGNLKNVVNLKVQEKQKLASNEESLALLKLQSLYKDWTIPYSHAPGANLPNTDLPQMSWVTG